MYCLLEWHNTCLLKLKKAKSHFPQCKQCPATGSGLYGGGLYGGGLYGGTLPTYAFTAEFFSNSDSTAEIEKMRTLRRSFSKNTYPTACGP